MTSAFDRIEPMALSTAPGRIAAMIRALILDGSLAPGTQLTETQLAGQLNVSRGPVREAMQRLVQERLLWTKPHHGTFVVDLGDDDAADIYLARRAVETTAATRLIGAEPDSEAFSVLDQAVIGLDVAIRSGEWSAVVDADVAFHSHLVQAAHSARLTRMFRTLIAETRLCMAALVGGDPEWISRAVGEHGDLVAALRRGDRRETMLLLDRHFFLDDRLSYVRAGARTISS